jgi:membrane dipeptidase
MIVDTHNDLLTELAFRSGQQTPFRNYWQDQLREGGVGLQVCPVYVPPHQIPDNALHVALREVAACHRAVSESAGSAVLVKAAADLAGLDPDTRIGLMLSMEGAEPVGRDLSLLQVFWELGVRMVSLTWNDRNALADGTGEPAGAGLSKLGRQAVAELARLGIIIDLAHASERTFYDVMDLAPDSAAVIVSHAGCRAVFDTPRNLTDEQLRLLAERGGVLGAMAHPLNVDPAEPTIARYLDHIDHAVQVMGERHVGLGADFIRQVALSGATGDHGDALLPAGMRLADAITGFSGPADYPALVSALASRGYAGAVLEGVLGENFLRVFHSALPAALAARLSHPVNPPCAGKAAAHFA